MQDTSLKSIKKPKELDEEAKQLGKVSSMDEIGKSAFEVAQHKNSAREAKTPNNNRVFEKKDKSQILN